MQLKAVLSKPHIQTWWTNFRIRPSLTSFVGTISQHSADVRAHLGSKGEPMHEIPNNIFQNKHWLTIKVAPTQNTKPITYESPTTSVPFTMKDADLNTIDMIGVVTQPPELTLTIYGNCPIWALTPPTIPSAGDGVRNNNAGNKHARKNIWKDLWLRSLDFFLTHIIFPLPAMLCTLTSRR